MKKNGVGSLGAGATGSGYGHSSTGVPSRANG